MQSIKHIVMTIRYIQTELSMGRCANRDLTHNRPSTKGLELGKCNQNSNKSNKHFML